MNEFVNYWMKQSYEARRAARFGFFPLNQPELPIEWENQPKRPKIAHTAIVLAINIQEES